MVAVAVYDDNEIFRRGLVACLEEAVSVEIVDEGRDPPLGVDADVAVTTADSVAGRDWTCPIIVCARDRDLSAIELAGPLRAVLPRSKLDPDQLLAAVHAAAAGLRLELADYDKPRHGLSERGYAVLSLLAEGATTRDISDELGYSPRTIKEDIRKLTVRLEASTRAEVVAKGIRRGLI